MAKEIERKFLIAAQDIPSDLPEPQSIIQGYFSDSANPAVRVRLAGSEAWLTIKGKSDGISRDEFEYSISLVDAQAMLDSFCPQLRVEKLRYRIPYGDFTIELDVFQGKLAGLIVAEVELPSVDTVMAIPEWFGQEVSTDHRYTNLRLAKEGIPFDLSPAAIVARARQLAEEFGIGASSLGMEDDPLIKLIEAHGGQVTLARESINFEKNSLIVRGPNDFVLFLSTHTGPLRDRFTLAHNLGHYFLHAKEGVLPGVYPLRGDLPQDHEANVFALELLVPEKSLREYLKTGGPEGAAGYFGVAQSVLWARLAKLNLDQPC